MQLVRTTIRLEKQLKKEADKLAVEQETTFQKVLNSALKEYVEKKARKSLRDWKIPTVNLGIPLDNITRDDIYGEPEIPC